MEHCVKSCIVGVFKSFKRHSENIEIVHVTIYLDCLIGICTKSRRNSSLNTEEICASTV